MCILISQIGSGVWRVSFGAPSRFTPVAFRSRPPMETDSLPVVEAPPLDVNAIRFCTSKRGCRLDLPFRPGEDLYGLGLQLKSCRQTAVKKCLRSNSDPETDLGDSHAPVPFYLSTAGYGVLIDTARYATFYCGCAPEQASNEEVRTSTDELYADSDRGGIPVTVEIPHEAGVDVYLFAGPGMLDALRRYILFSGGGALPPLWGLGVCYRGYGPNNQEESLALARQLREQRIPCDMFGLEPGWQSHAYSCSYCWDAGRYPRPDALIAEMRAMGFELNLWEHPFVHPTAPIYRDLLPYAGSVDVWQGLVPDFSIERAQQIYGEHHERELVGRGITGFKIDECDNSDYKASPWSFPEYAEFPGGMDGEEMHSLFGIFSQQALLKVFDRAGLRTWSNVRNSHALAAPLPFSLYSDLYDHEDFIRGMVNAGVSGLLWTPEVRQCESEADLLRRLQSVIFSPMALINGWMIKNPPWLQYDVGKNNRGELAADREAVTARCRRVLELRMQLIPYLYSAFARYRFEGIPPFRPLVTDYPQDPACRALENQYLVGDAMLFAPLTANETGRRVYLPAGTWHDFRTGEICEGGRHVEVAPALDEIALFIKDGALIPWARAVERVTPETVFELEPRLYGAAPGSCRLFDGDGYRSDAAEKWVTLRAENDRFELENASLYALSR